MLNQKLTKKQKKALAFRERKGKPKHTLKDDEGGDVPIDENQDLAEMENIQMEGQEEVGQDNTLNSVGKKQTKTGVQSTSENKKKRKRDDDESEETQKSVQKKKKASDEESTKGTPQRFILFIGNLRYTTSKENISSHFSACDPPPTVRLSTPKTVQPTAKSKGYAFLEFTDKKGLQAALRLHHSELDGRKINVELTAGGGGKSEHRLKKVKERNKGLHEQRKRRISRKAKGKDKDQLMELDRPQRYSTTSGIDQAPSNKKTWTIAEPGDTSRTKRPRKRRKDEGTGVNAIPVY